MPYFQVPACECGSFSRWLWCVLSYYWYHLQLNINGCK